MSFPRFVNPQVLDENDVLYFVVFKAYGNVEALGVNPVL